MEITNLISAIREYASAAGVKPETVARNATGNPRALDRLIKRHERLCADIVRIECFMAANPVSGSSASCLSSNGGQSVSENQPPTGREIPTEGAQ